MKIIVLAGGGGTRLWPLSRQSFPKQFLSFDGGLSLLQKTLMRFSNTTIAEELIVSTNDQYKSLVDLQVNKVAGAFAPHIVVEPCKRNTAPAIALTLKYLETFCNTRPSDKILVLPSDHLIDPEHVLIHYLEMLADMEESNNLVIFGIHPIRPDTGYGYIKIGARNDPITYHVEEFIEKPTLQRAKKFLLSRSYYWNTGMFVFSVETFWRELSLWCPEIFSCAQGSYQEVYQKFDQMPDLSIDYAILEKTKNLVVCPLPVSWSDVGSWDSVYDAMEKDHHKNVKIGNILDIDTKNCLIIGGKKLISTVGLEDLLIVETEEALFISKKGESQRVKKLVQELEVKKVKVNERKKCRISGGHLVEIFDFGFLPFSTFPKQGDPSPAAVPLKLCLNEKSGLVQLRHSVDPNEMYSEYWYMSGVNQSMTLALKSIVDEALRRLGKKLQPGDIVVDIASNDGTLLSAYPDGLFRVGIDPAKNIQPKACNLHINDFFSAAVYQSKLGNKKAEIVTSIAMFYDLDDPIQFSKDVGKILKPGGLWIIELSYLPTMLERNSFDTICSEHLEYYSLYSMEYILKKSGFAVEDVELNDVNGGSFRLYIRHQEHVRENESVNEMRKNEARMKLTNVKTYLSFASRVRKNKKEMIQFLLKQKCLGKKVIGYGASTKGNTIMSYYGIGPDLISHVADRNPIKWGRQTVTRIPIISEDEARSMKPDYFLAFPYHFMNEFIDREKDFLRSGGKFISPIPKLTIIGKKINSDLQNEPSENLDSALAIR